MTGDALEKLRQQRAALDVRIRRQEARIKGEERRRDTRRKILAGAAVLHEAAQRAEFNAMLRALLDRFLAKPPDRLLFDLPPRSAAAPASAETAAP